MTLNNTQKLDSPTWLPMIFGLRMLPSICWMTNTITRNHTASHGSIKNRMNALGMAPMNGPKNGMMLATPHSTAISGAYGKLNTVSTTKKITPSKAASRISPTRKRPHLVSVMSTISYTLGRYFIGINATASFLT